jgi:hypothetical protein
VFKLRDLQFETESDFKNIQPHWPELRKPAAEGMILTCATVRIKVVGCEETPTK